MNFRAKEINIGGVPTWLRCDGSTPHRYRVLFRDDLMLKMQKMNDVVKGKRSISADEMELLERSAFVMAQQGAIEKKLPIPQDIDEWLSQFPMFAFYGSIGEILSLWKQDNETTVQAKNEEGSQTDR